MALLRYFPGKTIVHSLDARIKILWLFSLLVLMLSHRTIEVATISVIFTMMLYIGNSSTPFNLLGLKFMMLIISISFISGSLLLSTEYGLINAAIIFSAVSLSAFFIATTKQKDIVAALRFFGLPASTAFSLLLSLYFIPIFKREFNSIRVAQASRGHSIRNPIPVIVPFLHSIFKRAWNLSLSMDARAFDPDNVLIEHRLRMRRSDWLFLVILASVVAVSV
ncbi:MAG: energy-coupling factor transporter transmembrane component T [Candidatus Micrarchaeota archaeon]